MKKCIKCLETKPLSNFGTFTQAEDGLKTQCRGCVAIYNKNYKLKIKGISNEPWQARIGFCKI